MNYRIIPVIVAVLAGSAFAADHDKPLFNTVKQKLAEGKQVVGGTVNTSDPGIYCAMANSGFDFMWIEMQHSPLNYDQVAKMIWGLPRRSRDPVHPRADRDRRRHPESHGHRSSRNRRADGGQRAGGGGRRDLREVSAARQA